MERIQRDDSDALALLYDRYATPALRIASRLFREPDAVEGIVQESFLSIWRRRATCGTADVGTWAMGIVRESALDALRHGHPDGPLTRLPDPEREVIALALCGQLTHTEIAERLALKPGAVKGYMRHGLRTLRRDH